MSRNQDSWRSVDSNDKNPYETFMRKHLQHYGYYKPPEKIEGELKEHRDHGYRHSMTPFDDWDKPQAYDVLSDSSDSDKSKDGDADNDNKTQEELLRTTQLVYSYQAGKMVPKLREPRQLYGCNPNELGPQQAARWPAEIQVLEERIKHIWTPMPDPEPFYKQSGEEKTPMSRSAMDEGRVVFEYEPIVSNFFIRSRVGGSRGGCTQCNVGLEGPEDKTLQFESRFESGNLAKAVQVGEHEYELWLRNDLYTNKHTQWYYFRVKNTRANVTYRFTIVNTMKPDSLYNQGMRPLMYSEKKAAEQKIGWHRCGSNIKYYRNNIKYNAGKQERNYYSLTWTCHFSHENDTCYFSHCYPYTYSDLQDYIADIASDPLKSKLCKQRVLCRTLAGNMVYVLTITSPSKNPEEAKNRKAVVITSRVHPGESNASWMMKGFIDHLMSNSADAKLLRDTFIFKIVPMLNPDGVIVGNYRCSLAGRDLNRNYKTVLKESFPSIWHTRNMIRKLLDEREVICYCDLHGHSRKQNVFIYGCENRGNPSRRLRERIFPVMLGRNAPDKFHYDGCKFKVQKSKEGTGRIVMWHMGIMNSYTMEATFAGSLLGKMKGYHFQIKDFEAMGYHFCDTLLDYCDPDNTKVTNVLSELEERLKMEIIQHLKQREGQELSQSVNDINLDDILTSDIESSDGGSDSSISDGLPVHLQYMNDKLPKKKKRLKSKKERDKRNDTKQKPQPPAATAIKYTTVNSKRPRSREDKNGFPVFAQERAEERASKKSPDGYLEALTNAYIRSGIIVNENQAKEVPHFRYTAGNRNLPHLLEGMCPHHEKAFAARYVSNHLQQFNYPAHRGPWSWYSLDVRGRKTNVHSHDRFPREAPHSILLMAKLAKHNAQEDFDDAELKINKPQSSKSERSAERRTPQKHLVELSAAQQRQQDILDLQRKNDTDRNAPSPIKQHPLPFDRALKKDTSCEAIRRGFSARITRPRSHLSSGTASSSSSQRVQSAKSLSVSKIPSTSLSSSNLTVSSTSITAKAELAAVDQRSTEEELTVDGAQAYKEMEALNNRIHGTGARPKLREFGRHQSEPQGLPEQNSSSNNSKTGALEISATAADITSQFESKPSVRSKSTNPPKLSRVNLQQSGEQKHTSSTPSGFSQSAAKTDNNKLPQNRNNNSKEILPDFPENQFPKNFLRQNQPSTNFHPSATHSEIDDTIRSYNEIRDALLDPVKRVNLSPTTGQFIENFVRKTDKEIAALTADEKLHGEPQASGVLEECMNAIGDKNYSFAQPRNYSYNPTPSSSNTFQRSLNSVTSAMSSMNDIGSTPTSSMTHSATASTSTSTSQGKKLFIKGQSEYLYNETSHQRLQRSKQERGHLWPEEDYSDRGGSGVARIYMNDIVQRRNVRSAHHSRVLAPPTDDGEGLEDMINGRNSPSGVRDMHRQFEFDRGRASTLRKSPSKISLLINQGPADHEVVVGGAGAGGQFQGLNRSVRAPPMLRNLPKRR